MEKFIKTAVILAAFFIPLAKAQNQELLKPPVEYKIIRDTNINGTYQSEKESIHWFNNEIEKRKSAENSGNPYKTAALKVTLQNLKGFAQHILDDNQFQEELTDDERNAYGKLLFDLNEMDANEPEYTKTIRPTGINRFIQTLTILSQDNTSRHQPADPSSA
ncbi:hypothetical protein NX722_21280 [Endozoicomonas gorgoniicola]|uniref:Uncharacterized protein n=1 Tax=Endozoicomonas gorgoniicola TaxID=1234144 RepID=A0ABT3N0G4_9GAMM|nr:hypothetical protein [Endozoicomonas gorgoniicola]MCW7555109.1 hypothetical protein [Endozoicomonas gorgoniicola]